MSPLIPQEIRGVFLGSSGDSWHTLTSGYLAGVTDWDSSLTGHQPAYRLNADNRVQLKGLIKAPAGGLAAFTSFFILPVGYRPGGEMTFATIQQDVFAGFGISPAGSIYSRTALAANAWMSIAATYYAEG